MQKVYILKGRPERVGLWEIWSGFLCISSCSDINLNAKRYVESKAVGISIMRLALS